MSDRGINFGSDIPYCSNGSFDFDKMKYLNKSSFWNKRLNREKNVKNDNAGAAVVYDQSLYEACQKWVYGKEDPGKVWEEYLYGGDSALQRSWGTSFKPNVSGLSVRLARALSHFPMLRTIFYHYCRIYSENPKLSSSKAYFAQLLIDTVRNLLPDIWQDEDLQLCAANDCKSFFCVFESLFLDYDRVKSTAKKVRLNQCVEKQNALPEFAALNEKFVLMESMAGDSTRELQKNLNGVAPAEKTKTFVEVFSPHWENHMKARGMEQEENACRFNDVITDILENLTCGEFREAEKQKNQESGAVGRALGGALANPDFDSKEKAAAAERFNNLRIIHESLDDVNEEGRSAYEWIADSDSDSLPAPEDLSFEIWETLSDAEKVLLIATSFARCKSYTGFYGILGELFPDINVNFIGINIGFKILSRITGSDFAEIISGKTSKAVSEGKLRILTHEYKTDFEYNLQLLSDCLHRRWFDRNEPENQRLSKVAKVLCQKLDEHNAMKARKRNMKISNGGDSLL